MFEKITKARHSLKVAFEGILHFMKKLHLNDIRFQTNKTFSKDIIFKFASS